MISTAEAITMLRSGVTIESLVLKGLHHFDYVINRGPGGGGYITSIHIRPHPTMSNTVFVYYRTHSGYRKSIDADNWVEVIRLVFDKDEINEWHVPNEDWMFALSELLKEPNESIRLDIDSYTNWFPNDMGLSMHDINKLVC